MIQTTAAILLEYLLPGVLCLAALTLFGWTVCPSEAAQLLHFGIAGATRSVVHETLLVLSVISIAYVLGAFCSGFGGRLVKGLARRQQLAALRCYVDALQKTSAGSGAGITLATLRETDMDTISLKHSTARRLRRALFPKKEETGEGFWKRLLGGLGQNLNVFRLLVDGLRHLLDEERADRVRELDVTIQRTTGLLRAHARLGSQDADRQLQFHTEHARMLRALVVPFGLLSCAFLVASLSKTAGMRWLGLALSATFFAGMMWAREAYGYRQRLLVMASADHFLAAHSRSTSGPTSGNGASSHGA
jgi:hypothetical protein